MIVVSSNEAANLVVGLVGQRAVNDTLSSLGAPGCFLHHLFGDRSARAVGPASTGWFGESLHGVAVVWAVRGAPYCLTVCTDGFPSMDEAAARIRQVSAACDASVTRQR